MKHISEKRFFTFFKENIYLTNILKYYVYGYKNITGKWNW